MLLLIIIIILLFIATKDTRRKNQENIDYLHKTAKNIYKKIKKRLTK